MMEKVLLVVVFLIPLYCHAGVVLDDGKEWRLLTDTMGFSWNDVSTVCNSTTGVCSGLLTVPGSSADFTGWIWASVNDVKNLFNSYLNSPIVGNSYFEADSEWAPTLVSALGQTNQDLTVPSSFGMVRTLSTNTSNWIPGIVNNTLPGGNDIFQLSTTATIDSKRKFEGVWLFRSAPTPTPEPGTFGLFGLGLAGLGLARRRHNA